MQKKSLLSTGLVILAAVAAPAHAGWGNKLWSDGRAEVAVYDSERVVDGKLRTFREHILVTKEVLNSETLAKIDNPKSQRGIDVFKLTQVQSIEADNYPRHTNISVAVKDDDFRQVVKASLGYEDWEGNGFKSLKVSPDGASATLWANEKSSELTLGKDDYIEDELPLSLRALSFKDGFEKKVHLWQSLAKSSDTLKLSEAMISVSGPEDVHCRAGSLPSWVVTVKTAAGSDMYWFEKAEPHLLVKMEAADGQKRLLVGRARWSFWDRRIPRPNILN